jgi:hypothetical protein
MSRSLNNQPDSLGGRRLRRILLSFAAVAAAIFGVSAVGGTSVLASDGTMSVTRECDATTGETIVTVVLTGYPDGATAALGTTFLSFDAPNKVRITAPQFLEIYVSESDNSLMTVDPLEGCKPSGTTEYDHNWSFSDPVCDVDTGETVVQLVLNDYPFGATLRIDGTLFPFGGRELRLTSGESATVVVTSPDDPDGENLWSFTWTVEALPGCRSSDGGVVDPTIPPTEPTTPATETPTTGPLTAVLPNTGVNGPSGLPLGVYGGLLILSGLGLIVVVRRRAA